MIPSTAPEKVHSALRTRPLFQLLLAGGLAVNWLAPATAHAEVGTEVSDPYPKGVLGGMLLGSEMVLSAEALLGVEPWWAYAIGGGAGAIAGGIGGYFIADAGTDAVPMGMLTAGLVLAVPTTIWVLSATAYQVPEENFIADQATAHYLSRRPQMSLANLGETGQLQMRLPAVGVTETFTPKMRAEFGLPREVEVRIPLLDWAF